MVDIDPAIQEILEKRSDNQPIKVVLSLKNDLARKEIQRYIQNAYGTPEFFSELQKLNILIIKVKLEFLRKLLERDEIQMITLPD